MTDKTDVDLPTAASEEDSEIERKSVLELLEECKAVVANYANRYLTTAEYNERMCNGDQFIEMTESYEIAQSNPDSSSLKLSRNLLRNLRLTWSSRILEDRPNVQFWPGEAGMDQIKTDVAKKVWEHLGQVNDFDDLCFQAAELVQPHSAVGFKIVWDPLWGPREPTSGKTLGEVRWQLVSVFDYGTDGSEDIEDSKWVYFCKYIDEWDARTLLDAAGINEPPSIEDYTDVWGVKRERCVKLYELWVRPDDYRFPNGLYAVIVGNHVVEARDFPYDHGELPLAIWKCGARRNSPYGSTHVDDATPIQKLINECVIALGGQARLINSVKLLAHADIVQKWQHGHQRIPVNDPQMSQYAKYLEPPDRVKVLVSTLEDQIQALFAVFGLNEMLTGAENIKSGTAAKSIAYINKLDSMKMAGAARSLAKAIKRVATQSLKLSQQYVQAPRLLKIAGTSSELPIKAFVGADIAGVDVVIQPSSGIDSLRASIAETANGQMQQAGPTPELQATSQTGLKNSAYNESQREFVYEQIKAVLSGQEQPQADPEIDPNIAVDAIITVMSDVDPSRAQALLVLLQAYKGSGQRQQQQNSAENLAMKTANGGKNPL
jgi:hypothetical protein